MSDWKNVQYKDGKMRTSEGGGGGGSSTFAGLDDVSFDNLQNGQVPKYNATTQKWENADESGGTVTDVQVDGVSVVNQQGVAEIESGSLNIQYFHCNGTIFKNGGSGTITGNGSASILICGNIARIDFDFYVTTASGGSGDWAWGIDSNQFTALNSNIPAITPMTGGWYRTTGMPSDTEGYATVFDRSGRFWRPCRYYTTACDSIGGWPASQCRSGSRWRGCCYGTVQ